jgi:2,4-dienoyl-CoA reductase-like NADH-dependent reductase (Old Yellow Enzyme family)
METILFSPIRLREVTLRNRIVVSPMLQYAATGGHINDWHLTHLGKFAAGGAGLVFMESTKVESRGCSTPKDAGLWKDDFVAPLRRVTELIKKNGAVPGIQLGHSGRKARRAVPWEGRTPLTNCPGVDHGEEWELIGPSPIAHSAKSAVPREMTRADIDIVLEAWGEAARRANEAGFEVLEIHGGHGYLVHQFLSPAANQRTDEYGGSLEKRLRFALEVARRVRRSWPGAKPLFFRISAVDESGWTIEDSVVLARALKENGVDVVDCSSGGMSEVVGSEVVAGYGYQVPYAHRVRAEAGIMTMAVGMIIHADQAEGILQAGSADLVALAREFLHNPNWPLDAAQKLGIDSPFSLVSRVYGHYLERRARTALVRPSTWQKGIHADSDKHE